MEASISESGFGTMPDGRQATLFTLTSRCGAVASVTNAGAILTGLCVPDRYGIAGDVVLGFDRLAPYLAHPGCFGMADLHGLNQQLWTATPYMHGQRVGLALSCHSALDAVLVYELCDMALEVRLRAVCATATPFFPGRQLLFNLRGDGDVLRYELTIAAEAPCDFRATQTIGAHLGQGYDHDFILTGAAPAARVHDPDSGRTLVLTTDQPGLHFYSGDALDGSLHGKGQPYQRHGGFGLDPQALLPHQGGPTQLQAGEEYLAVSKYSFSAD